MLDGGTRLGLLTLSEASSGPCLGGLSGGPVSGGKAPGSGDLFVGGGRGAGTGGKENEREHQAGEGEARRYQEGDVHPVHERLPHRDEQ